MFYLLFEEHVLAKNIDELVKLSQVVKDIQQQSLANTRYKLMNYPKLVQSLFDMAVEEFFQSDRVVTIEEQRILSFLLNSAAIKFDSKKFPKHIKSLRDFAMLNHLVNVDSANRRIELEKVYQSAPKMVCDFVNNITACKIENPFNLEEWHSFKECLGAWPELDSKTLPLYQHPQTPQSQQKIIIPSPSPICRKRLVNFNDDVPKISLQFYTLLQNVDKNLVKMQMPLVIKVIQAISKARLERYVSQDVFTKLIIYAIDNNDLALAMSLYSDFKKAHPESIKESEIPIRLYRFISEDQETKLTNIYDDLTDFERLAIDFGCHGRVYLDASDADIKKLIEILLTLIDAELNLKKLEESFTLSDGGYIYWCNDKELHRLLCQRIPTKEVLWNGIEILTHMLKEKGIFPKFNNILFKFSRVKMFTHHKVKTRVSDSIDFYHKYPEFTEDAGKDHYTLDACLFCYLLNKKDYKAIAERFFASQIFRGSFGVFIIAMIKDTQTYQKLIELIVNDDRFDANEMIAKDNVRSRAVCYHWDRKKSMYFYTVILKGIDDVGYQFKASMLRYFFTKISENKTFNFNPEDSDLAFKSKIPLEKLMSIKGFDLYRTSGWWDRSSFQKIVTATGYFSRIEIQLARQDPYEYECAAKAIRKIECAILAAKKMDELHPGTIFANRDYLEKAINKILRDNPQNQIASHLQQFIILEKNLVCLRIMKNTQALSSAFKLCLEKSPVLLQAFITQLLNKLEAQKSRHYQSAKNDILQLCGNRVAIPKSKKATSSQIDVNPFQTAIKEEPIIQEVQEIKQTTPALLVDLNFEQTDDDNSDDDYRQTTPHDSQPFGELASLFPPVPSDDIVAEVPTQQEQLLIDLTGL